MSETTLTEENTFFTDLPVGEILRRTREHYGRSLQDIEKTLRIRAEQLQALENNELDKLPGKVYAIGFVRTYSEYLGLDGDKMVELFKLQFKDKAKAPELHFPANASESKLPAVWLVMVSIFVIITASSLMMFSTEKNREELERVPEVPKEIQQAELEKPEIAIPDEALEAPAPEEEVTLDEKPKEGIILNIRSNSWVEIKDKAGKRLLSQVLKAGDQYLVPTRPDLLMSLGNAGGVEIEVDGQPLQLLGGEGIVRRDIPLDGGYLKSKYIKPLDKEQ